MNLYGSGGGGKKKKKYGSSTAKTSVSIHKSISMGFIEDQESGENTLARKQLSKSESYSSSGSEDERERPEGIRTKGKREIAETLNEIKPVKHISLSTDPNSKEILKQARLIWMKNHRETAKIRDHNCIESQKLVVEQPNSSSLTNFQGGCKAVRVCLRAFSCDGYKGELTGCEHVCLYEFPVVGVHQGAYFCECPDYPHMKETTFVDFEWMFFCSQTGNYHLCKDYCDCSINDHKKSDYGYRCNLTGEPLPHLGQMYLDNSQWKAGNKDPSDEKAKKDLANELIEIQKLQIEQGTPEDSKKKRSQGGSAMSHATIRQRIANYEKSPNFYRNNARLEVSVLNLIATYPNQEAWTEELFNSFNLKDINRCLKKVMDKDYPFIRSRKQQMVCMARGIVLSIFHLSKERKTLLDSAFSQQALESYNNMIDYKCEPLYLLGTGETGNADLALTDANKRDIVTKKFYSEQYTRDTLRKLVCSLADKIVKLWILMVSQTEAGKSNKRFLPFLYFCFASLQCYSEGVGYTSRVPLDASLDPTAFVSFLTWQEKDIHLIQPIDMVRFFFRDGTEMTSVKKYNTAYVRTVHYNVTKILIDSVKKGELTIDALSNFNLSSSQLEGFLKTVDSIKCKPEKYVEDYDEFSSLSFNPEKSAFHGAGLLQCGEPSD